MQFDGECASRNIDPLYLPLSRLLNLIYWYATRNAPIEEIRKFDTRLFRPPPGVVPTRGPWTAEAETAAFNQVAAMVSGGKATQQARPGKRS